MTDVNKLITDNIDVWTSAIKKRNAVGRGSSNKIELTGIKKLRELILELAVRGKLGTQNVNDEPASILLEKIAEEKTQLIAQKKFKKQIALPVITDEEKTTELPIGWEWARLQSIIQISSGNGLTSKQMNMEGKVPVYGGNGVTGYHDAHNVDKRTLVIGRVGFYCGSVHITPVRAWITDNAFVTTFSEENIYIYYLSWLLKATNLNENDSATAQPVISGRKLYPIVVCLPPLAEQHRIVAKVDKLMALCDQLEQQTEQSLTAHQTLVEVLLAALTDGADADDFQTSWQRIAEHFDILFTTEHSIEQLKQTILQLAVMGKLVPQNPSDEPASILLEKLSFEQKSWLESNLADNAECKTMLRKLNKLKSANAPFLLPKSWACVHLIQTTQLLVDCHNKTAPYTDSGIPIIRTTNIREREFRFDGLKYVNEETYDYWSRRCPPKSGDIMFTREAPMGEAAIIPEDVKWCLGQRTMLIRPMHEYVSNKFILLALTEPHLLERASEHAVGLTVKHLRVGDVENLNIPLPPLAEQNRIVAKLDELMALCEQLKARLSDAQTTQIHLADAVVENALSAPASS
ncbi:restriction endonuclease subunit S [Colwellia sp. BRX10-6]|uniref:restriction endonuclease subunit S n=1 Tax=unclassified Colwellia TaxID=196834 RepID=UPI0015F73899|nr:MULTISPECIES: restriction endonuclease subunit S [unclassified Colwellia]MBA6382954.1 restriction endonuclease subunit S [Colwellia sp. BRX10-9]MBA6393858.1 restriction endonuclease subunit S [Colwellia sp. BRX10-6]